ncbi:NifU family protein [bacterium]|nr:MAG: NifU family protein [bacterium]
MTNDEQPSFSEREQIKGLIEQLDSYISHYHGGTVEMVSYDGKTVAVRLGEACLDCPLQDSTVHGWVEGTLRQFFPDIEVVQVQ